MSEAPLRPGDVIAGKYRVDRVLGVGGMGIVVAARHLEIGRRVALKFMRKDALDKGGIDRFLREARVAASIESDHVAQVLDVGRTPRSEPYLVMELLEGRDLSAVVARGALVTGDAAGYILEACEGLAAAHARGLVHRDIKLANLFLATRPDGTTATKLLDFGLARSFSGEATAATVTTTGSVLGSPQYMAPEQLMARPLEARTDVWALGVCLFELLTTRMPFEAPTVPALCAKILHEEPRDPCELRPDLDQRLGAVVLRCLRKDPAERFATVAELAGALEPFAPDASGAAERVANVLRRVPAALPAYDATGSGTDAPTRIVTAYDSPAAASPRSLMLAAALVALVVGSGALVVFAIAHRPPTQVPAVSATTPVREASTDPVTVQTTAPSPALMIVDAAASTATPAPTPTHTRPRVHPPPNPPSSNPLERF